MANRTTTHVLKNSDIVNRPLPSSLLKGEPIINTAEGIMYFSGVTTSTSGWTQSGPSTPTFFEVGSNLYDLKIRNQITSYSGVTNLNGLFLSGTSNGFILAPVSSIAGVDTYVTNFSYNDNNVLSLDQNNAGTDFTVLINQMSGLTVNGTLSATTANFGTENVTTLNATGATITTLGSTTINVNTLNATGGSVTTAASNPNDIVNYSTLTAYSQTNDIYVTGGTITYTDYDGSLVLKRKGANDVTITGLRDVYLTGGTYGAGTITLNNNSGGTFSVTGLTTNDTYVTGFTYSPTTNTFTIKQNQGQPDLTQQFTTVSGLTFSNLTAGRVVYVGAGGLLTDDAGFTYDAGTNTFSVPSDGTVNVGTGGLNVAGDAVIQGSLTVFGPSVSAFTSELYVEDPNITLNYNPTGNTIATSIGSGWMIQDGNGVNGGNVNLNINSLDTLTGLTVSNTPSVAEYLTSTGYANRGWITQLNDIVIRSTNVSTPNGVRVLAEFDVLDGGTY